MQLNAEESHTELLQSALINLGNLYAINRSFDVGAIERETERFADQWRRYNPRKPHIPRFGLSLTSLDGGMSGTPDLDSLREYNRENGTALDETSFTIPTPALLDSPSLRGPLEPFIPHMGRSHLLRMDEGGFFPLHRDSQFVGQRSFRLISLLSSCGASQFCFLYDNGRIFLEQGQLYFLNTKIEHAIFSFAPRATLLVLNMRLSRASVDLVIENLLTR